MFLSNISNFIAGQEWIFVINIAVVLIFGAKKIPELAKTFGKAKGEFEKGKSRVKRSSKTLKKSPAILTAKRQNQTSFQQFRLIYP